MNTKPCQHNKPWTRCKPCRKAWRKALYWRDPVSARCAASEWGRKNKGRVLAAMTRYLASLKCDEKKAAHHAALKREVLRRRRFNLTDGYVAQVLTGGRGKTRDLFSVELLQMKRAQIKLGRIIQLRRWNHA